MCTLLTAVKFLGGVAHHPLDGNAKIGDLQGQADIRPLVVAIAFQ
jgi:hypothetical protein